MQSDRAGLLYALAGFCTLSIGDAIIKGMAGEWPAPAMAATRYVVGTLLLAILLARSEGWPALRLPKDPLQWVRGVAISLSAVGMFLAVFPRAPVDLHLFIGSWHAKTWQSTGIVATGVWFLEQLTLALVTSVTGAYAIAFWAHAVALWPALHSASSLIAWDSDTNPEPDP